MVEPWKSAQGLGPQRGQPGTLRQANGAVRGLTGTRLLLSLATTKASTLRGCTSTSTTAAATSTTTTAASTTAAAASTTPAAATEAPTPGTTPTSTATPSASSTASAAAPAIPSTTLASLALAVAAPPTRGRRSSDLLSANKVDNRDQFLSLCPTKLTVDLLKERLTADETSIVAVGASRGDPRAPFFEGCSPVPPLPSVASTAVVHLVGTEEVGAESAPSGRCRSGKGKGGKGGGGDGGGSGGGGGGGRGGWGGGGGGGGSGGVGGGGGGGGGSGSGSGGGGGGGAGRGGAAQLGGFGGSALGASESAAPGASESSLSGTAPAEAMHTFTLDSGASRSFFRDNTTLTLLSRPVAVSLADPSGDPDLAHSSTVLAHCRFTPGGQLVTHCTCTRTGRHLATFTRRPGSSLYTLTTESPTVAESGQVAESSQVWPPVPLSLVSPGLSLPSHRDLPLPAFLASKDNSAPLLTPPSSLRWRLPCILSTWTCGAQPASVDRVTSDNFCWSLTSTRVTSQSSPCAARVRSLRGGEFSSDLPRAFCRAEGIRQTFTLPASPQQNGIAERRIGMVMDVARTSMIHAAAPHFLWPFAVQYAAHQLNLQPRVSMPETTPALRWTGEVGDASVFHVWGSRAFVRDSSVDKLSSRAVPCVFLGSPPDASGLLFYHPTLRRILSSQDVTFDESVPYYRLFPYRTASLPPPPLFLTPGPPPVDPLPPQGPAPLGVSELDPIPLTPVERAEPGGAEPVLVEPGGVEPERAEPGGAEPGGAASPGGTRAASLRQSRRREPLSPQHLREWYASYSCPQSGPAVAGGDGGSGGACTAGTGAAGTGGGAAAGGGAGAARGSGGAGAAGFGGARPSSTGAAGTGGTATTGGPGGARTAGTGAAGAGGAGVAGGTGAAVSST
ncbi:unnamed protein product [Closterium sp. NIES-54]